MDVPTRNLPDAGSMVQPGRLKRLLRHLIDTYSPSGKEEELLDFLYNYLKRRDLPVIRQDVDDSRYNLLVVPPEAPSIDLALVGHLDTVVAYDFEQYGFDMEEDEVRGLGAADMKGGCAAMVEAYLCAWERYAPKLPVALAMIVGEEEDGDGAQQLVREYHFPWVIIGEPTDLEPCLSHHGYLEIQLLTRGKRAHASLAHRGKSPVESMLKLLLAFTDYMERKRHDLIYNIRDLYSYPAGFVVPDRCEVWIDTHVPTEAPVGDIIIDLEELVEKEREKLGLLDMTIQFTTVHGGYEIPDRGAMVDSLKETFEKNALPWNPGIFRSHSDANIFWEAGIKPVILGPGQIDKAHVPEESVSFEQVTRAARIYTDCLIALASASS